jgi:hypothetical protein
MGLLLPTNVRGDGGLKARLAELLERRRPKERVIEGCGAQSD